MRQEKDPNFAKRKGGQKRKAEGEARAPAGVAPGAEGGGGMGPPPPKKPKMAEAQQAQQSQNAAPAAAAAAAAGGEGKQEAEAAEAGEAGAGAERHASVSARGLRKTGPTTVFVKHLADNVRVRPACAALLCTAALLSALCWRKPCNPAIARACQA